LGRLTVQACCRECGQLYTHEDALWRHVRTDHLPDLFRVPTYDEAKESILNFREDHGVRVLWALACL
jgi:hypothetical protein